jgi:hypothetical protein
VASGRRLASASDSSMGHHPRASHGDSPAPRWFETTSLALAHRSGLGGSHVLVARTSVELARRGLREAAHPRQDRAPGDPPSRLRRATRPGVCFSLIAPKTRREAEGLFSVWEWGNQCRFVTSFDVTAGRRSSSARRTRRLLPELPRHAGVASLRRNRRPRHIGAKARSGQRASERHGPFHGGCQQGPRKAALFLVRASVMPMPLP